jgi:hypothetical protein
LQTTVSIWRRLFFSAGRIAIGVITVFLLLWWIGIKMPGKNVSNAASLSASDIILRDELKADVQELSGNIGERNLSRYPQLNAAAEFIEKSFRQAGLQSRRDSYDVNSVASHNIEVEIRGASPAIVLVGAHYDSVFGAPGANDNGALPANKRITPCASLRLLTRSRLTSKHPKWEVSFMRDAAKLAAIASQP